MKPLVTPFRDLPAATLVGGVLQPAFVEASYAGSFFHCRAATNPFRMAFDAGQFFDWQGGYLLANTPFKKIMFANDTLFPMRIYFSVGTENVDFSGTADGKISATFELGNGGSSIVSTAIAAKVTAGTNYDWDGSTAAVDFSINAPTIIPGTYQGHRRKQITFQVQSGAVELFVFDPNGGLCKYITNNSVPQAWETSSDYYVLGRKGTAKFIYSEIYYSN